MKKLFLLISLFVLTTGANAVPALPGQWKLLTLADGTQVKAELCGDEFCHYWRAENGRCYIESTREDIFVATDMKTISEKASQRRQIHAGASHRTRGGMGSEREPIIGKKKGLVLLVEFKNKTFEEGHNWEFYNDVLNKVGFKSDLGFIGSVKDYFLSQSYGQFELDFDLVGPLKMPNTYGYYGANTGDNDTNPGLMSATACQMADEFVNFKDYDWDGDGEVDQVFIIYAGLGEAAGGDKNTIWPHEWKLQYSDYKKTLTLDEVVVDTYACGPELTKRSTYGSSAVGVEGIGTICHEFTHCLGIPDMYDTGGSNYAMSTWDVMCRGSYNGNSFAPANFTSYERMYCGWLKPTVLNDDTTVEGMKALGDGGEAYIIYNDACPTEYYLLENRQQKGWDSGLSGSGLLVIHIDYDEELWYYNLVNNTTDYDGYNTHQRCTIIPADNNFGNSDIATDVFPYKDKDCLTNTSLPRAELYNLNPDGIHYTSKPITQIKQEDGLISFVFQNQLTNKVSGIQDLQSVRKTNVIYDLQGRSLGTSTDALPKGIYIIGGKKVVK